MKRKIWITGLLALVALTVNANAEVTVRAHTDDFVGVADCLRGTTPPAWTISSGSCITGYGIIAGPAGSCPTSCSTGAGYGGSLQYTFTAQALTSAEFALGVDGTASTARGIILEDAWTSSEGGNDCTTKCIARASMLESPAGTCTIRLLSSAGATISGTLLSYTEAFGGDCNVLVRMDNFDWTADTFSLYYDGVLQAATVTFAVSADTATGLGFQVHSQGSGSAPIQTVRGIASDVAVNGGEIDFTITPTGIPGIRATVVQAFDGNDCEIDLYWKLSANDPDQVNGVFLYDIFLEGVSIGDDTITAADSDGIRYARVVYSGGTANGAATLYVTPRDPDFENLGPHSDAATVDCATLGSTDSHGTLETGGDNFITGSPATNTGNPIGQAVQYFNSSWGFDGSWLFGLFIVGIVTIGFTRISRAPLVIAVGVFLGVMGAVLLGLFQIWVLFVMMFLIIAVAGATLFAGRRGEDETGE